MEVGTFTQRPEVGGERGVGEGGVGQSAPQRVGGECGGVLQHHQVPAEPAAAAQTQAGLQLQQQ